MNTTNEVSLSRKVKTQISDAMTSELLAWKRMNAGSLNPVTKAIEEVVTRELARRRQATRARWIPLLDELMAQSAVA